jgi:hypothetical protein
MNKVRNQTILSYLSNGIKSFSFIRILPNFRSIILCSHLLLISQQLFTDDKVIYITLVHALRDKAAGEKKQHGIMIPELLLGAPAADI